MRKLLACILLYGLSVLSEGRTYGKPRGCWPPCLQNQHCVGTVCECIDPCTKKNSYGECESICPGGECYDYGGQCIQCQPCEVFQNGQCQPIECGYGRCDSTGQCVCDSCYQPDSQGKCTLPAIDCGEYGVCKAGQCECIGLDYELVNGVCQKKDCGYGECDKKGRCICSPCYELGADLRCSKPVECGEYGICNPETNSCECTALDYELINGICQKKDCGYGQCDKKGHCICDPCYEHDKNHRCTIRKSCVNGKCDDTSGQCICYTCFGRNYNGECTEPTLCGDYGICNPDTNLCECTELDYELVNGLCQKKDCGHGQCDKKGHCICAPCYELGADLKCTKRKHCANGHCDDNSGQCICNSCFGRGYNGECTEPTICGDYGVCNPNTNLCECTELDYEVVNGICQKKDCGYGQCDKKGQCICAPCYELGVDLKCSKRKNCVNGHCDDNSGQCICNPCFGRNYDGECTKPTICGEYGVCNHATNLCECTELDYEVVNGICQKKDCGYGECDKKGHCICAPCYELGADHRCTKRINCVNGDCDDTSGQCVCHSCFGRNYNGECTEPTICGEYGICNTATNLCECTELDYELVNGVCQKKDCGYGQCDKKGRCICAPCYELGADLKCSKRKNCGNGHCDDTSNQCICNSCFGRNYNGECTEPTGCGEYGVCNPNTNLCECTELDYEVVDGVCQKKDCGYGECDKKGHCICAPCYELGADQKCSQRKNCVNGQCDDNSGQCICYSCFGRNYNGECTEPTVCGEYGVCNPDTNLCECTGLDYELVNGLCQKKDCGYGECDKKGHCICAPCYEIGPDQKCSQPTVCGEYGVCNPAINLCECTELDYELVNGLCQKKDCGYGQCDKKGQCICAPCYELGHDLKCTQRKNCVNGHCDDTRGQCICDACFKLGYNGECTKPTVCGEYGVCNPSTNLCECTELDYELVNGICQKKDCGYGECDKKGKCICAPCYELGPDLRCTQRKNCVNGHCDDTRVQCICNACFKLGYNGECTKPTVCGEYGLCNPATNLCECTELDYELVNGLCQKKDCGYGECDKKGHCICAPCYELGADLRCTKPKFCGEYGVCNPSTHLCECTELDYETVNGICQKKDCGYGSCNKQGKCICDPCYELNGNGRCTISTFCGDYGVCDKDTNQCICIALDHELVGGICHKKDCGHGRPDKYGKCTCYPCYEKNDGGRCTRRKLCGDYGECNEATNLCECKTPNYELVNGICQKKDCGYGEVGVTGKCLCNPCFTYDADAKCRKEKKCGYGTCIAETGKCRCDACHVKDKIGFCSIKKCGLGSTCVDGECTCAKCHYYFAAPYNRCVESPCCKRYCTRGTRVYG